MAIWTAFSGGSSSHQGGRTRPASPPAKAVTQAKRRPKAKRGKPRVSKAERAKAQAEALFRREANDNVVSFPAA